MFRHGRGGIRRQQRRGQAPGRRSRGRLFRQFFHGPGEVPRVRPGSAAPSSLVRGDILDADALQKASRGCDTSSISPRTPTCGSAPITPAGTWSRTPSARSTSWRPCGRTGSAGSRFPPPGRSTGKLPSSRRPEDAPFPVQTSLYGASKLAGEGLISAYCEAFGMRGLDLPVRLDPGREVFARARVRLLPEPLRGPDHAEDPR